MPSNMREAVAGAIGGQIGVHDCTDLAADAALAVIRERLAEKVPEATYTPEQPAMVPYEKPLFINTWNACRAAMLRELGGDG